MTNDSLILKDEGSQIPIPELWRSTFKTIIEALKEDDFRLGQGIVGVRPISKENSAIIANNIVVYGCRLASLPEETWDSSVCLWMDGYWDVLVDLYTEEEGASDLVLAARVYEEGASFAFELQSVYVP